MMFPIHDSAVNPRARRCLEIVPAGQAGATTARSSIRVTIGIGTFEEVHHIEIRESVTHVIVTAFVGIAPEAAQRRGEGRAPVYTMQRLHWTREFPLSAPLGGRTILDGALIDEHQP
jgi:hypothetical protein